MNKLVRGALAMALCLFGAAASAAMVTMAEREPNNDSGTAMVVPLGTTIEGALVAGARQGAATDIDFFRVPVASPGKYTIALTPVVPGCDYALGVPNTKRARGPSTILVELTGQQRTIYTLRLGGQPEDRSTTLGAEPRELVITVDTVAWSSDSQRGVQCVKDGPRHKEIPYRLTIAAGDVSPPPPPPPLQLLQPPPDNLTQEITIAPGSAWEGQMPATKTLELVARLAYDKPAGAQFALDISVNGQRLSQPLLNKGQSFRYADGRTFPYYDGSGAPGWLVFYSPDFNVNNTPAAGGYQVMTDPGQAYRYQWDITSLAGASPTARLRLYNNGRGSNMPIVVRLAQSVIVLPPPPQSGKVLRVVVQDEQGRAVAGTPVRVGASPCAAEATTDASGTAVLRFPPGCQ